MTNENKPPVEVMTAPEGYEWTGEFHEAGKAPQLVAIWSDGKWRMKDITNPVYGAKDPVIRKLKPPTVTVTLPRDVAARAMQAHTDCHLDTGTHRPVSPLDTEHAVAAACRAALEQEGADG